MEINESKLHHNTPIWSIGQQMLERKLLYEVSDVARLRHLSLRTEETRLQLEAIIITVMVLEMKAPHGRDLVALRPLISLRGSAA